MLPATALTLFPLRDIVRDGIGWRSTSHEPWFRIAVDINAQMGRVIEISYSAGLYDSVVRPLIRFVCTDGTFVEAIAAGVSEAVGFWYGRVPDGTSEVWISPTNRKGSFEFQVHAVRRLSLGERLARIAESPKRSFFAISARAVGLTAEADLNARWAYGRAETSNYGAWRQRRQRYRAEPSPIVGPTITVAIDARDADATIVAATRASLSRQTYINWRLVLIGLASSHARASRSAAPDRVSQDTTLSDHDVLAFIRAGDVLVDCALACIAAHFAAHPEHRAVYSDEIAVEPSGKQTPIYKPDWSPIRQAVSPYVGRAVFVRANALGDPNECLKRSADSAFNMVLAELKIGEAGHVRRALMSTRAPHTSAPRNFAGARAQGTVRIIIPTRDRINLLAPCIESIFGKSTYRNVTVVVVDNGSVEQKTHLTLQRLLEQNSRLSVLPMPGAFNFSGLCNFGAASAPSDFLLFLNNDTLVCQPDWIENLIALSALPDIGAVGAKLIYPDTRVQHKGVVLGLGGVAGHFGAGQLQDATGWLGGDCLPHETCAVTGACLMVERGKFDAVGGFDATNLPVELSDIDLCLELGQRGWRTICDCRTQLVHLESASRSGSTLRLQRVYDRERRYFIEKWRHVIRDDPYFNPSLSLYDYEPQLA